MDDIGSVHEQKASQNLVCEVLDVVVREILSRIDHSVKIGLHQLGDDVDIRVAGFGLRFQEICEQNDVVVFEEFFVKADVLSSFISRTILLASMRSSKALMTCVRRNVLF